MGILDLCSSDTSHNFLFVCDIFIGFDIFNSGIRMSSEIFFFLILGIVWENRCYFLRCLVEFTYDTISPGLLFVGRSLFFNDSILLHVITLLIFLFLLHLVFKDYMFWGIYFFCLGCQFYWCVIVCIIFLSLDREIPGNEWWGPVEGGLHEIVGMEWLSHRLCVFSL